MRRWGENRMFRGTKGSEHGWEFYNERGWEFYNEHELNELNESFNAYDLIL